MFFAAFSIFLVAYFGRVSICFDLFFFFCFVCRLCDSAAFCRFVSCCECFLIGLFVVPLLLCLGLVLVGFQQCLLI